MTTKSIAHRIVEGIAILAVVIVAVPVVVVVGSRLWPDAEKAAPQGRHRGPLPPPVTMGPEPQRNPVDSVDKLPATYPAIAELVLATDAPAASPFPGVQLPDLPAVEPAALQGVGMKHLNAYISGELRLSPVDADLAVVEEFTPAGTYRLAVWDLKAGKLLRFLSSETGKAPRPYQGKENADFGAKIDLRRSHRLAFAPSGKRFAARQASSADETYAAYAWDVATGKLLSRYEEPAYPYDLFLFPHDDYLVISQVAGNMDAGGYIGDSTVRKRTDDRALVRLDVNQGEAELLGPVGVGVHHVGQGAHRAGLVAFLSPQELHTIDVVTRQHLHGLPLTEDNRFEYVLMWCAADGASAYGMRSNGKLDVWDLGTREFKQSQQLKQGRNILPVLPAPAAGLVVLHEGQDRDVGVFDVASGKLVSILQLPFRGGRVRAISSDARRLVVSTDQFSLLVVDFPNGLPAGKIDLGAVVGKAKLPATR